MYLTTHSAFGIALATKTVNPLFAFIFAFIAHYILDIIPHGDESIFNKDISTARRYKRIISVVLLDLAITAVYVFFVMTKVPLSPVIIFAAVLGSILPDIIWGIYDIKSLKILKPFVKLHNFFHNPSKKILHLNVGLIGQGILIILLYIITI